MLFFAIGMGVAVTVLLMAFAIFGNGFELAGNILAILFWVGLLASVITAGWLHFHGRLSSRIGGFSFGYVIATGTMIVLALLAASFLTS